MRNNIFYKLEFGDRWELCYEAKKHLEDKFSIEFKNVPGPKVYHFEYMYGSEERIALECPTKPPYFYALKLRPIIR